MSERHIDKITIWAVMDLHKVGFKSKEICIQKGLKLFTVQEQIQKFQGWLKQDTADMTLCQISDCSVRPIQGLLLA